MTTIDSAGLTKPAQGRAATNPSPPGQGGEDDSGEGYGQSLAEGEEAAGGARLPPRPRTVRRRNQRAHRMVASAASTEADRRRSAPSDETNAALALIARASLSFISACFSST